MHKHGLLERHPPTNIDSEAFRYGHWILFIVGIGNIECPIAARQSQSSGSRFEFYIPRKSQKAR